MADNYWSAIMNGGSPEMFPGQAPAVAENPILKLLQKGQKPNPLLAAKKVPVVAAKPPMMDAADPTIHEDLGVSPVAKGSGLIDKAMEQEKNVDESTNTDKKAGQTQTKLWIDDPTFKALTDRTEGLDTFRQQKAGINQMRDMLAIAADSPTDVLTGPLSGLLQSEFGRNPAGFIAGKGMSPQEQQKNILAYSDKIQDDQKDYSKNLFESIGKQQGGQQMQSYLSQLVGRNLNENLNQNSAEAVDPNKFNRPHGAGKGYTPDKDVKELGKSLAPFAPTLNTLKTLDQLIGGIDNWHGQNIPGAGFGGRMAPSFLLSAKGSQIQQTYREMQEELLKLYNGSRITNPEYARLSQALGANLTGGDREFVSGLRRFRDEFKDVMAQKEAPYRVLHPEVVSIFHKGGGQTSDTVLPSAPQKNTPPPAKRTKNLEDMSQAELDAYEASLKGKH